MNMKKRILLAALALAFVLAALPAMAAANRNTAQELNDAVASGELIKMYVGICGASVETADGQETLNPGSTIYVDPSVETASGYAAVVCYQEVMAADGSLVSLVKFRGVVDARYIQDNSLDLRAGYGGDYYQMDD